MFKLSRDLSVRAGTNSVEKDGEVVKVRRVRVHPRFNPFTFNGDFALLELAEEIKMEPGSKEAIKLPLKDDKIEDGTEALVSGWGKTQKSEESREVLRGVIVPTVNLKECKDAYTDVASITNQMICAGDFKMGGIDSCQGKISF